MAFALRALVGSALVLAGAAALGCGSPSFTAAGGDGGGGDGGTAGDGSTTTGDGGGADAGADANADLNLLACPGAPGGTCDTGNKEVCCLYKGNGGGMVGTCDPGNQCQGNPPPNASGEPTQLSCTRTRQCGASGAADVCCITKPNGGNPGSSSCKPLADCVGSNVAVLCDTQHPECPGIFTCATGSDANFGIAVPLGICK
jgi:hypothetical protein